MSNGRELLRTPGNGATRGAEPVPQRVEPTRPYGWGVPTRRAWAWA